MRAGIPVIDYDEGLWDEALSALDEFIAEIERGTGHVQEATARADRGEIRLARGDISGAVEDAERSLAAARRQPEPQMLIPALSFSALVMYRTGRIAEAKAALDELVAMAERVGDVATVDAVTTLDALGRRADLARVAATALPGRWSDLFAATAEGRFVDAADVADELGVLPSAAKLRLRAAQHLAVEGRAEEARAQIEQAAEFWRSVGATEYLRECEEIAATALVS
jgi:tetratricopeptide (TPR) repeat protein